jgi:hypothetical protein
MFAREFARVPMNREFATAWYFPSTVVKRDSVPMVSSRRFRIKIYGGFNFTAADVEINSGLGSGKIYRHSPLKQGEISRTAAGTLDFPTVSIHEGFCQPQIGGKRNPRPKGVRPNVQSHLERSIERTELESLCTRKYRDLSRCDSC